MTETNTQNAGAQNNGIQDTNVPGVTVKMSKLIEGIGIVFSGILTMLESLDASTAKKLTEGFTLVEAGAEEAADTQPDGPVEAADTVGAVEMEASDAPSAQKGAEPVKPAEAAQPTQAAQTTQPASGLTVDDVARIVVRKVKANPGINDKIRALVNAHGAQRVTELKPESFEAFLTDLSQM